ncbi:tumor necrosis factor ligand superfamily member 14-like [Centropristis striata]|uniref:tumor necrosis factor ligand superfamily member 14-like n=1 Tax=Centropristis striata TaxID=184440 RepID=UPI0027E10310|nr:tumor necrosis factor ligand superfamily member 14-like [Centropristis striata]
MAEGDVGACPQVFVVDSQANYISVPGGKKPRWARSGQKFLLLLVGLSLLGLVIEGCFIYTLYKKTEKLQSSQQSGTIMKQSEYGVHNNEIHTVTPPLEQSQQRPFAQLIGSINYRGQENVVLWEHKDGHSVSYNMNYNDGRLVVEKKGYYYIYSKLTINAVQECVLIQHRIMRETEAYDAAIELVKSKSYRCRVTRHSSTKATQEEDLWNSFLAGIFHLDSGDKIYVKLDNLTTMRTGPTDNLMGAFMIYSGDMLR